MKGKIFNFSRECLLLSLVIVVFFSTTFGFYKRASIQAAAIPSMYSSYEVMQWLFLSTGTTMEVQESSLGGEIVKEVSDTCKLWWSQNGFDSIGTDLMTICEGAKDGIINISEDAWSGIKSWCGSLFSKKDIGVIDLSDGGYAYFQDISGVTKAQIQEYLIPTGYSTNAFVDKLMDNAMYEGKNPFCLNVFGYSIDNSTYRFTFVNNLNTPPTYDDAKIKFGNSGTFSRGGFIDIDPDTREIKDFRSLWSGVEYGIAYAPYDVYTVHGVNTGFKFGKAKPIEWVPSPTDVFSDAWQRDAYDIVTHGRTLDEDGNVTGDVILTIPQDIPFTDVITQVGTGAMELTDVLEKVGAYPVDLDKDLVIGTDISIPEAIEKAEEMDPTKPPKDPDNEFNFVLPAEASDLTKKFPFSIPFDIVRAFKKLSASSLPPDLNFEYYFAPINYTFKVDINLEQYKTVLEVFRIGETILFVIGLGMVTGKLTKWGQ